MYWISWTTKQQKVKFYPTLKIEISKMYAGGIIYLPRSSNITIKILSLLHNVENKHVYLFTCPVTMP